MKHTHRSSKRSSYPVTIQTPYGVLRLAYEIDLEKCPSCGEYHAAVEVHEVSPRLKSTREGQRLLGMLAEILATGADLAFLHSVSGAARSRSSVI